jgi:hypothetical protein
MRGLLDLPLRYVKVLQAFVIPLVIILAACPPTKPEALALLHYTQLGGCTRAQTGNGVINVPGSHAVVIFRVSSIDNRSTGKSWSFDSTALQVNPPSQFQQNLGGTGAISIATNANVAVNTPVGIMVETANADGSDASTVNYFLLYPRPSGGPGVLPVKDNPTQVSYPFAQDCNAIAGR